MSGVYVLCILYYACEKCGDRRMSTENFLFSKIHHFGLNQINKVTYGMLYNMYTVHVFIGSPIYTDIKFNLKLSLLWGYNANVLFNEIILKAKSKVKAERKIKLMWKLGFLFVGRPEKCLKKVGTEREKRKKEQFSHPFYVKL